MDIENLKKRKEKLENELKEFIENAQRQIERYTGAIAILNDMIIELEKEKEDEKPD